MSVKRRPADPFRLLGVSRTATQEEIDRQIRALKAELDEDTNNMCPPGKIKTAEKLKLIHSAQAVLCDRLVRDQFLHGGWPAVDTFLEKNEISTQMQSLKLCRVYARLRGHHADVYDLNAGILSGRRFGGYTAAMERANDIAILRHMHRRANHRNSELRRHMEACKVVLERLPDNRPLGVTTDNSEMHRLRDDDANILFVWTNEDARQVIRKGGECAPSLLTFCRGQKALSVACLLYAVDRVLDVMSRSLATLPCGPLIVPSFVLRLMEHLAPGCERLLDVDNNTLPLCAAFAGHPRREELLGNRSVYAFLYECTAGGVLGDSRTTTLTHARGLGRRDTMVVERCPFCVLPSNTSRARVSAKQLLENHFNSAHRPLSCWGEDCCDYCGKYMRCEQNDRRRESRSESGVHEHDDCSSMMTPGKFADFGRRLRSFVHHSMSLESPLVAFGIYDATCSGITYAPCQPMISFQWLRQIIRRVLHSMTSPEGLPQTCASGLLGFQFIHHLQRGIRRSSPFPYMPPFETAFAPDLAHLFNPRVSPQPMLFDSSDDLRRTLSRFTFSQPGNAFVFEPSASSSDVSITVSCCPLCLYCNRGKRAIKSHLKLHLANASEDDGDNNNEEDADDVGAGGGDLLSWTEVARSDCCDHYSTTTTTSYYYSLCV